MDNLASHYNSLATERDQFRKKHPYYYDLLYRQYQYFIPQQRRVLEVGCSTGELLNVLRPSYGVGIDISHDTIDVAQKKFLHLNFMQGTVDNVSLNETFDDVVLSGLLGELEDIESFLKSLRKFCHQDTRVIIEYYSYFWQYILKVIERLGLKMPQKIQNWITAHDIENFLTLAGYEVIKKERIILVPFKIWVVSDLINRFIAKLPIINAFTLNHFIIARPLMPRAPKQSVTILVPCRNERGNIETAVTRTPVFGTHQEFIFVEGGSKDGTYEEVEKIIKKYPHKDIKLFKQTGQGKGDAVRLGFSQAKGDILMILDADLTVAPEDLPKFYDAITSDKGEFINGCRLVYQMEKEAMRFLNLVANKFFGIFFSWLLGQRFRDTLCGTKVLYRCHYEQIAKNRDYFGDFDPFGDFDLIFGAIKLNLKVTELPIRYRSRQYGTTQIQRFKHGLLLFRMCGVAMKKIKFI